MVERILMSVPLNVVLFSCALLGFRHGFDYDHIAAITDIAGVQTRVSDTIRLGSMYALGHAATVAVLGGVVIAFQLTLPHGMDSWAERFVGLTLIALAIYVFSTLVRKKGQKLPKSRASILIDATGWIHWRLHKWITGDNSLQKKNKPSVSAPTCFGIGVIHGLGAETPSQVALFLMAANLGGMRRAFLGLTVFLIGLLTMNTLMTASAAGVFTAGRSWSGWHPFLTGLTAAYSFCIGVVFLLGDSSLLRSISG
jgi:high-affinity nickel permease